MEELKVPFHCIITGPTNCGKTKYLIEQLRGPFKNVFDYIDYIHAISSQNLSKTDEALKLYNRKHPDVNLHLNEHIFHDYYQPSNDQKIGEMIYVGGGMLSLGYLASKWL